MRFGNVAHVGEWIEWCDDRGNWKLSPFCPETRRAINRFVRKKGANQPLRAIVQSKREEIRCHTAHWVGLDGRSVEAFQKIQWPVNWGWAISLFARRINRISFGRFDESVRMKRIAFFENISLFLFFFFHTFKLFMVFFCWFSFLNIKKWLY